jgi:hypothetical protein
MSMPAILPDPAAAAALIAPGLQPETARRLLQSPRLAARAAHLLTTRLGNGDMADLNLIDQTLMAQPLDPLALSAGAVWHARRVCTLVLGTEIAELSRRCGTQARQVALRHVDLAPEAEAAPTGDLAVDILQDGRRCVAAWVSTLPDWAANRVRLQWHHPSLSPMPEASRALAVQVVRRLAADAQGPGA